MLSSILAQKSLWKSAAFIPAQLSSYGAENKITGTADNDTIKGSDSNDELCGEKSNDSLVGGAGSDIFFYKNGNDSIRDFDPSFDKIYVNAANIGSPKVNFRFHAFSYFP